jgi:hypothetical protein
MLFFLAVGVALADDAATPPQPGAQSAAELVRAALESEAAGKLADRAAKLREVLAADPSYAPAHWQTGQVLVDGRWISVVEPSEAGNRQAGRLAQYRQLRHEMSPTVEDHLRLARFCREARLTDQERMHLALVLQLDRGNKEALTKMKALRRPPDPKATAHLAKARDVARQTQAAINASARSQHWSPCFRPTVTKPPDSSWRS